MFNVECWKLHGRRILKIFRGMLLNRDYCGLFFRGGLPERGLNFSWGGCDLHRNCGMVVILLSFLCNYDNLTLILHQEKRNYPEKGWIFIGRFKVGSVPKMSAALAASRKSIKIHHEYDKRPLIKSYNSY